LFDEQAGGKALARSMTGGMVIKFREVMQTYGKKGKRHEVKKAKGFHAKAQKRQERQGAKEEKLLRPVILTSHLFASLFFAPWRS
jgi:hypothetical protein